MEIMSTQNLGKPLFKLPEIVEKESKKRRYAKTPDTGFLKAQQKEAWIELYKFLEDPKMGMFCLEGFAGTGKTTVINTFVEHVLSDKRTWKIAMTAPTNKAVQVLNEDAEYFHTNLSYSTIHSLLGLKEVINDDGEMTFERDWDNGAKGKLENIQMLCVDEVSMLDDKLFEMLVECLGTGLKIVFVGDPAQIPPVNREDCLPFNPEARKEYGMGHFRMTEIIRQAVGNPIIQMSMALRENVNSPTPMRGAKINNVDEYGRGVHFYRKGDPNVEEFEELLEHLYCSENAKQDVDFVKVMAWRNKTVNYLNKLIREMIYKKPDLKKLEIGEKLIADKPILHGEDILFTTNEELTIRDYTIGSEVALEATEDTAEIVLKYYQAKATKKLLRGGEEEHEIRIIHEDSEAKFQQVLKMLREYAFSTKKGTPQRKKAWQEFWNFFYYFAHVKYNYAITCHKSQGSTYDVGVVIENDIVRNRNVRERNRIMYTAFTRPRRLLIVID